jgi:hypothetical protein
LLALHLGPFSVALVGGAGAPHMTLSGSDSSRPTSAASLQLVEATSVGAGTSRGTSPVARLEQLVAERQPDLAHRLAATGEPVDAAFYARWLKARGGCLESAAAGILAHASWRCEFVGAAAAEAATLRSSTSTSSATASSNSSTLNAFGSSSTTQSAAGSSSGIPEVSIADELAARKVFLQGLDAHGCPVAVVKAAR